MSVLTFGFILMCNDRSRAELVSALQRVKTLTGLLPICATCKSIRDDQGYWQKIEQYVRDHSDADFSHSICPECAQRLFPDRQLTLR